MSPTETNPKINQDQAWMRQTLELAKTATAKDEVPIGALVVNSAGEVVTQAHNLKESGFDPCGHAEILVLRKAGHKLKTWRLTGCTLYVTLEPCMMCCGALVQSRISRVVFGAFDPKAGFVSSVGQGLDHSALNHHPEWEGGVLEQECGDVLRDFFKKKRS